MTIVRGTCVVVDGCGVLLRGPSGAGKSDLALRLIEAGGRLVADDYTAVVFRDGRAVASAPENIRDLLEVRGLGVLCVPAAESAAIAAVVDLVAIAEVPRMPDLDVETVDLAGAAVPRFRLAAFEASAPAKVRLAVGLATGGIMRPR